jgi:flagellar motor switch protein FliN
MPAASVDVDRVASLMNDAAEAAAMAISSMPLLAGVVAEGTVPAEFIPDEGSVAVRCKMRGLPGQLVFIAGSGYIAHLRSTNFGGHQTLLDALDQGLTRAASVLDQAAPRAIRTGRSVEVDADEMLGSTSDAWWFGASPLFSGEEHFASIAVFLDDPALAPSLEQELNEDDPEFSRDGAGADELDMTSYQPPALGIDPVGAATSVASAVGATAAANGHGAVGLAVALAPLRLLHDVEMDITVELGRTKMTVRNVLGLTPGSVIELDRAAGAPVDLLVNGTLIGRGEVVVIDEEFGVRISEIVGRVEDAI